MLSFLIDRLCCNYFGGAIGFTLAQPDTINNPNRTSHTLFRRVSEKQHLHALMAGEFFIQLLPVRRHYESCYRGFAGGGDSVAFPTNTVKTIIGF